MLIWVTSGGRRGRRGRRCGKMCDTVKVRISGRSAAASHLTRRCVVLRCFASFWSEDASLCDLLHLLPHRPDLLRGKLHRYLLRSLLLYLQLFSCFIVTLQHKFQSKVVLKAINSVICTNRHLFSFQDFFSLTGWQEAFFPWI